MPSIPDTGQTTQYRVGDDSNYGFDVDDFDPSDGHAGLSYTKLDSNGNPLPNTATSWEFVKDNRSELIYKMGMGQGTWAQATADAAAYTALGLTWRLPTIREWVYLANYSKFSDMFDPMVGFIDQGEDPWSSTDDPLDSTRAFCYETDIGLTDPACYKTDTLRHIIYVSGPEIVQNLVDNGDDTITDTSTGLMWTKYFLGSNVNWEDAIDGAISLSLAGHEDWRLPNIKELQSIIDYTVGEPTINTNFFPVTQNPCRLWSSTTSAVQTSSAWCIYLQDLAFQFYLNKFSSADMYALAVREDIFTEPVEFWHKHTRQRELLPVAAGYLEKKPTKTFIPGDPGQPYRPPTPATEPVVSVEETINYICVSVN
jgi:hypothetical protein